MCEQGDVKSSQGSHHIRDLTSAAPTFREVDDFSIRQAYQLEVFASVRDPDYMTSPGYKMSAPPAGIDRLDPCDRVAVEEYANGKIIFPLWKRVLEARNNSSKNISGQVQRRSHDEFVLELGAAVDKFSELMKTLIGRDESLWPMLTASLQLKILYL